MIALYCPCCGGTTVIKFGATYSDTPRCRCHGCGVTFTRSPKSRADQSIPAFQTPPQRS